MPLPPPIIPETEDSAPSPVSEASSGYISTSISAATLSEVYTLSWDLPPSSGFEAVPNEEEEDNKVTQYDTYPESFLRDQSEPQESLLVLNNNAAQERTDLPPFKLDCTPSDTNLSQQEPNQAPSVQLKEQVKPDSVAESDLPCQTKQKQDSTIGLIGSEELDNSEPPKDSLLEQENETKRTEFSETDHSKPELSVNFETQSPAQEGQSQSETIAPQQPEQDQTTFSSAQDQAPNLTSVVSDDVLVPAPAPSGDLMLLASSEEQATSEDSNPNGTSIPTLSSTTHEVQEEAPASRKASPAPFLASAQPSKPDASVANPFKIQKVKSSGLKSFQRILGEEEKEKDKLTQVGRASSLGTGLNLSVPMESLEIISDSEEGDSAASAVLPEWLKEGEFVTVGTNKSGIVRYVGPTDFAEGTWVGVELEVPAGEYKSTQSCCYLMDFS